MPPETQTGATPARDGGERPAQGQGAPHDVVSINLILKNLCEFSFPNVYIFWQTIYPTCVQTQGHEYGGRHAERPNLCLDQHTRRWRCKVANVWHSTMEICWY